MIEKRVLKRVFFAMVMMAMLMVTVSLTAEEGGGEDIEGYCSSLYGHCSNECAPGLNACLGMGNDFLFCHDQYGWCFDECVGGGDFWCGFRQV